MDYETESTKANIIARNNHRESSWNILGEIVFNFFFLFTNKLGKSLECRVRMYPEFLADDPVDLYRSILYNKGTYSCVFREFARNK